LRLLLVEDHQRLATLMRKGLKTAGFDADIVGTADEASAALGAAQYDAMVLDLGLPDRDGIDLLRTVRERSDPIPVLVVTSRIQVADRVLGLNAGADDYLTKPFAMDELAARLRALLRRPVATLAPTLGCGNLSLQPATRAAYVNEAPVMLSPREVSLLENLLRQAGKVVTKAALEDSLYGAFHDATPNSLEVMVHRLRRKLTSAGASATVHTVRGVGYMIADDNGTRN